MTTKITATFSTGRVDPTLDRLFLSSLTKERPKTKLAELPQKKARAADEPERPTVSSDDSESDAAAGTDSSSEDYPNRTSHDDQVSDDEVTSPENNSSLDESDGMNLTDRKSFETHHISRKKRKRENDNPELEAKYMAKISKLSRKSLEMEKTKSSVDNTNIDASSETSSEDLRNLNDAADESDYEIPKHESIDTASPKNEVEKASRTVFLGNVSTDAIKSKESMRELNSHLTSFLPELSSQKNGEAHKIESFRFRSVAFSTTSVPRKAAFAKKELMDATTRSTNAYVVYSTAAASREAVTRLNGTVVLGRHLRVDSVAHPTPVDHHRCVFVGNLGFVDDESLIRAAENDNESEEPRKKKQVKPASDIEEGLWRTFGTVGTVESVRVVRDKTTRVGKGIAYVQFKDQVAAEKALGLDGKKFPPLLPRLLRVTRAKKPSKTSNAIGRQREHAQAIMKANETRRGDIFNPKLDTNARSVDGRAAKLLGRAGASQAKRRNGGTVSQRIRRPEDFVFEGRRAKENDGKSTMNLKPFKSSRKGASKPQSRSSKRGAAFKAAGKKR